MTIGLGLAPECRQLLLREVDPIGGCHLEADPGLAQQDVALGGSGSSEDFTTSSTARAITPSG